MNVVSDRIEEFFERYKQICGDYNVIVTACGCCVSPYFVDTDHGLGQDSLQRHFDHLQKLIDEDKKFEIEKGAKK